VTAELPPRIIALAIADLAADRVRAAWRCLEAWRVLSLAGVPVLDVRHALETPEVFSEPLTHVRDFEQRGSRGMLVEHGVPGTGKTYSAVKWLLGTFDRNVAYPHSRGLTMCWLAASTWPYQDRKLQDAWLRRGEMADRLVLDDLGAGASAAEWTRGPMEGMLMNRLAAGRPTLLVSNANGAELRSWLGPRLVDRIAMGGRIVEIKSRKSLRVPDDAELDDDGRSPVWHANTALVAAIGCRRVDGVLEVGHVLERDVEIACEAAYKLDGSEARRVAFGPCKRARILLSLDPEVIQARAAERHAREHSVCGELAETYGITIGEGGLTFHNAMDAVRQLLERRPASTSPPRQNREPIRVPTHVADTAVDAARELALRHHMHVKPNADGETFDVLRWTRVDGASHVCAVDHFEAVATGQPSEGQAWLSAALLVGDELGEAVSA
jgi:hypothetical protein